jgi:hypothetical protein
MLNSIMDITRCIRMLLTSTKLTVASDTSTFGKMSFELKFTIENSF